MTRNNIQQQALIHLADEYTNEILHSIFRCRRDWELSLLVPANLTDPFISLQWLEYELIDWHHVITHSTSTLVNSYCIRKGLIRKAQMWLNIQKFLSKRPQSILVRSVPETWVFEIDHPEYFEESMMEVFEVENDLMENMKRNENDRKVFVIKPSLANKAAGLQIFDSLEKLRGIFVKDLERSESSGDESEEGKNGKGAEEDKEKENENEEGEEEFEDDDKDGSVSEDIFQIREWVIQRYISRPLLLRCNRKFHIRAYVLAVSNIRIYLYRDMLALFALHTYNPADLDDALSHLTNTCIQMDESDFNEEESVKLFWDLTQDGLSRMDMEGIFEQIKTILKDLFEACAGEMTTFQSLRNAFELFGFDFLVDMEKRVYLLEANSFPDFKQTGDKLKHVIEDLFKETVKVAVDSFFNCIPEHEIKLDHFVKVFEKELLVID